MKSFMFKLPITVALLLCLLSCSPHQPPDEPAASTNRSAEAELAGQENSVTENENSRGQCPRSMLGQSCSKDGAICAIEGESCGPCEGCELLMCGGHAMTWQLLTEDPDIVDNECD